MNIFRLCKILHSNRNKENDVFSTQRRSKGDAFNSEGRSTSNLRDSSCLQMCSQNTSNRETTTKLGCEEHPKGNMMMPSDVALRRSLDFHHPYFIPTNNKQIFNRQKNTNNFFGRWRLPKGDNVKENILYKERGDSFPYSEFKMMKSKAHTNRKRVQNGNFYDIRNFYVGQSTGVKNSSRLSFHKNEFAHPEKHSSVYYQPSYRLQDLYTGFIKPITENIAFLVIGNFLENSVSSALLLRYLQDILPIYLISGYIYLCRYLDGKLNSLSQLSKVFFTCCWISAKASLDKHVHFSEIMPYFKYNPNEISYIEAHILSKINYDIEVSKEDILKFIQ